MQRYQVGLAKGNRAIIDALNLADLEQKLIASKMQWVNIRPYVSLMRAEFPPPSADFSPWEPLRDRGVRLTDD